jgi:hypothetical protein
MKVQLTHSNQPWHAVCAVLLFYFVHLTGALAQNATATVNFDQLSGRTINKGAFGLNLFQGFDPNQAGNPGNTAYKDAMAFIRHCALPQLGNDGAAYYQKRVAY